MGHLPRMGTHAAEGETIWTFCAPESHWREGAGRAGYALVREGRVVDGVATRDQLAHPAPRQTEDERRRDEGDRARGTG